MRTKHLLTTVFACAMLLLTSCATKQRAINQLEDFSVELRRNSRYYNVSDWQEAGQKFIKLRENIHKHEFDYTPEQKAYIGELEGECAGYMAKGIKDGFIDKLKGVGAELNGILQGILKVVGSW